ncbi:MAG: S4 domain-containing protein [Nitrospinota bacterium]
MRLDSFLKASRLVKRRTQAKGLCEEGAVEVNGYPARAGRALKPGDRVLLRLWRRQVLLEVADFSGPGLMPREAGALYRIIEEKRGKELEEEEGGPFL